LLPNINKFILACLFSSSFFFYFCLLQTLINLFIVAGTIRHAIDEKENSFLNTNYGTRGLISLLFSTENAMKRTPEQMFAKTSFLHGQDPRF
jgi:hypothetical protein